MPEAKVNTWSAVDKSDQPTGEPLDIVLNYETYGDAANPPLLLCPGCCVSPSMAMWGQDFIDALVAGGFYVVAYDARDSGLSTKVTAAGDPPIAKIYAEKALGITMQRKDGIPYFVTDLATDAVGLLDQLGIAAVHVLGFSNTGGSTAERLLIDFSARVLSLTLISASTADWGLPAPPAEVNKAFMDGGLADAGAVDADAAAFLLGTGKIIMKDPMDEARVQPIASASASRCPPDPVLVRRHLTALLSDLPRVEKLQTASAAMARNAAECARGTLEVVITSSEKMPAPSATSKAYTAFVAEVKVNGEVVKTIKSRYSEFLDLRDRCESKSIWKGVVGDGKSTGFAFPPKSVFGSFESTIIKDRIAGITAWFAQALATPGLKDCYEICGFLGVPAAEASPCVVVHGGKDKVMALEHAQSCCKSLVGADLVVIEDMGHELLGFEPCFHAPIVTAVQTAAKRAGTAGAEPEPEPSPKTRSV